MSQTRAQNGRKNLTVKRAQKPSNGRKQPFLPRHTDDGQGTQTQTCRNPSNGQESRSGRFFFPFEDSGRYIWYITYINLYVNSPCNILQNHPDTPVFDGQIMSSPSLWWCTCPHWYGDSSIHFYWPLTHPRHIGKLPTAWVSGSNLLKAASARAAWLVKRPPPHRAIGAVACLSPSVWRWSATSWWTLPTVDGRNPAPPWMVETCWNPVNTVME